jgi:hypothetical protein
VREGAVEAAPRLDGRADHDELRAALGRDARDFLAEAPRPGADDLPPYRDSIRTRHGGGRLEPLLQAGQRPVHVRVEGQLAGDHERRDEHDAGSTVRRKPAREIERVFRLRPV